MSRRFLYSSHHVSYALFAYIFAFAVTVLFLKTPIAFADPHAVFYTDRAQEQLFYNTLAALNQADFVEPVTQQFSREDLLKLRSKALASPAVQFEAETNPLVTSTKTDLPAILSRSITLEGNDLWTAYLVHQFALETTSRRSESEVARIFCERGLGRVGCDATNPNAQQQEAAFVTKPVNQESWITVAMQAIFGSGKTNETAVRREIATNAEDQAVYKILRPNSPSLAALNKKIEGNQDASQLLSAIIGGITGSTQVDPGTFDGVTFDDKGGHLDEDLTSGEYLHKLKQLTSLASALPEIGQEGARQALAFQHYAQNPTAMADYILEPEEGNTDGSGAVLPRITVPSAVKKALAEQAVAILGETAASQKFTNTKTIQQSGDQSLVDPNLLYENLIGQPDKFRNVAQNTAPQNPQVAGITTFDKDLTKIYENVYNAPQKKNLSPSAKDESILLEPGIFDTLRAVTDDTFRKGISTNDTTSKSAFSLQIDTLLSASGTIASAILCALFPSIASCVGVIAP